MPIELKGNNYYSRVFKRANYKLQNSMFWVEISWVRALNDPSHHGFGWHIGSEVWVSFALGSLDHHLYHYSRHTVTCFDLAFMGWVAHHYHTLLHFYPNFIIHFLLHPFIICLIPSRLLLSSSNVVSLYEQRVLLVHITYRLTLFIWM